jgi:hypothetical protein
MTIRLLSLGVALALQLVCASLAAAVHIDTCGQLERYYNCLYFSPLQDSHLYRLDNYGGFGPGEVVRVSGESSSIYPGCWSQDWSDEIVHDNTIVACPPTDLGCYRIFVPEPWDDISCPCIVYPECGPLAVPPSGFASGDSVRVFGVPDCRGGWTCHVAGTVLLVTVKACSDTITAVLPISWGRIRAIYR